MQNVKVVVVGDGGVGKSCFLISWTTNSFPSEYVPTVFDNYGSNVMVDGKPCNVSLWDTAGQEDYDRLRPLSYPQTDIFLVCFSVNSLTSLHNVSHKWAPEVRHHCPDTPLLLVGMKSDLRDSTQSHDRGVAGVRELVTPEQAKEVADTIGAEGYYETSALAQSGVNEAMMAALGAVMANTSKTTARRRRFRWPWRRLRQSPGALADSTNEPSIPPPPELPANEKAPWINIPSSSYATDWSRHINSPNLSDVTFELGDVRYSAHRLVLCASSDLFRALFGVSVSSKVKLTSLSDCSNWSKHRLAKVTRERVNEGKVEGILSMEERTLDPTTSTTTTTTSSTTITTTTTVITLNPAHFTDVSFLRCLTFLYTGMVDLDKESEQMKETISSASLLNLPELALITENAKLGEEFLNPSIGTWLNDRNAAVSKDLFLNKNLFSDISFRVEGRLVPAHKLVMCLRCDVMSAMLTGGFRESQSNEIDIIGFSSEGFLAFLEYLYTDHAPIEDGDSVGILELSNHYVLPRLMALCELYISKEVERATSESINKADIDVIGLLLTSQLHNATQLDSWCLHFISSNFFAFHQQESFSLLEGVNLEYMDQHRWPPLSYEQDMEEYRKKYLKEEEEEGGKEEGEKEGGKEGEAKGRKGKMFKFLRFWKHSGDAH